MTDNILLKIPSDEENIEHQDLNVLWNRNHEGHSFVGRVLCRIKLIDEQMIEINNRFDLIEERLVKVEATCKKVEEYLTWSEGYMK